jgi:hypothetical protein
VNIFRKISIQKLIILQAILLLLFCNNEASFSQSKVPESLHVGAILPMSGDYAQYGRELWRGLELAQAELKEQGDSSWDPAIVQVGYQGFYDLSKATKTDSPDLANALLQYFGPTRAAQRELALYLVSNSKVELAKP